MLFVNCLLYANQRRALYLFMVRSIFEDCCQVWAPQEKTSLHAFDLLQKRAVKWISKESHTSYSDQLLLQKQRDLDILPMRYKFIFSEGIDHLQYRCTILPKLNAFKNTFFVRTLKSWNDLPLSVRDIESFDKFSVALKDYMWLILGFEPD